MKWMNSLYLYIEESLFAVKGKSVEVKPQIKWKLVYKSANGFIDPLKVFILEYYHETIP